MARLYMYPFDCDRGQALDLVDGGADCDRRALK